MHERFSRQLFEKRDRFVFIHMKMPFTSWLKTNDGSVFAVICAVGSNDTNVIEPVIFHVAAQRFADFLAAVFFALLSGTDV